MKRIQKKVKDLVEVRPYKSSQDFVSNPSDTLAAYHFTDFTSDLMVKFLDRLAAVNSGSGAALALAGYRGVGKSHFLAAFGTIIAHPELRSRINEPHVAASLQQLKRTSYPVAYVRRGTHDSLLEEFRDAVAAAFNSNAAELSLPASDLLKFAVEKSGASPFVLIVDTAFERASRVAREDGAILGEIADLAKPLNVFIAVALDDDIAGADGVNAAIARSYTIDYLDQEHLYRIVDTHIFQKQFQVQSVIHDIYTNFREVLPHFRWSEQRFAALYPLHPVILEIAPFVRLYVPDFALLGFASEAGAKILGRPANSLIALDEVFDSVETPLRKIADLKDAFAVYDQLNSGIIAQIPVFQRLQAKLVLKALFLLSLKGEGATAGEIGAAVLIYDENEPPKAVKMVEDLLESFAAVFPKDIKRTAEADREIRYNFEMGGEDSLNIALYERIKNVSPEVISKILRVVGRNRFSDWTFSAENSEVVDFQIAWRGSLRNGRLIWNLENKFSDAPPQNSNKESLDWEVYITPAPDSTEETDAEGTAPKTFWKTAELKKDEIETLQRYYILQTDAKLREEFGEQIRAVGQAHLIAAEKIWNRVFLEDANIFIDGFDYNFTEEARGAQNLSEILPKILDPFFEAHFPNHPNFVQTLTGNEVSILVNDFFSGARQNLAEPQRLAEIFALPLDLVVRRDDAFVIQSEENLLNLPVAREILSMVENSSEETVSLENIYAHFRQSDFGLAREAQQLVLTALVAKRKLEFVTSNGNRINRRSLDLKIVWDDIEGVGKPTTVIYSNKRLAHWAKLLTGANSFESIETSGDRRSALEGLKKWLTDWQSVQILERFNALPDEILNTKIWRLATGSEKTFGSVNQTVEAILNETVSLEEGLHRIVDAFSDLEETFFEAKKRLSILENFINGASLRESIWSYLALCETTPDEEIETRREKLFQAIEESGANPSESLNEEMENLWQSFYARFSDYFAQKHDAAMKAPHLREKLAEIRRSEDWLEFENLSQAKVFGSKHFDEAQEICRRIEEFECRFEAREMLKTHPFCVCSFTLANVRETEILPRKLENTIGNGLKNLRGALKTARPTLIASIEQFAKENSNGEFAQAALQLKKKFETGANLSGLSESEFSVLRSIAENPPARSPSRGIFQSDTDFPSEEELLQDIENSFKDISGERFLLDTQ